jgi:hypothetical protein
MVLTELKWVHRRASKWMKEGSLERTCSSCCCVRCHSRTIARGAFFTGGCFYRVISDSSSSTYSRNIQQMIQLLSLHSFSYSDHGFTALKMFILDISKICHSQVPFVIASLYIELWLSHMAFRFMFVKSALLAKTDHISLLQEV